jgi:hypothetical protein
MILLNTTNTMQRFRIWLIIVNALHVSDGFSAHHQELKNCTNSIWYVPGLLAATAGAVGLELVCIRMYVDTSNNAYKTVSNSPTPMVAASKQASLTYTICCVYSS